MDEPSDMTSRIPDKLYYKIGEVSRIAQVPPSVLRFWESEFPRIRPQRSQTGQRLYRKSHVELILTIKHLLYDKKYTIPGARQYLNKPRNIPKQKTDRDDLLRHVRNELGNIKKLLD